MLLTAAGSMDLILEAGCVCYSSAALSTLV